MTLTANRKLKKELNKDVERLDDKKQSKLRIILDNITVEPMLGGYIISSVLTNLATQNLYLEKACRVNLNYGPEICDALAQRKTENYTTEERMVQELVAGMSIWKTFLQSIIPAVLILFVGSWSDRHCRRKPCMLLPVFGDMLTCAGLMLTTYYESVPMQVSGFIEAIFPALTGGWITMFMAVFSYIGNVATVETRTLRIGVVNIFCSVGIPIGIALSGVILKHTGYYGVYSISLVLYTFSFIYGVFFIYELPPNYTQDATSGGLPSKPPTSDGLPSKPENVSFLKDFFDVRNMLVWSRVYESHTEIHFAFKLSNLQVHLTEPQVSKVQHNMDSEMNVLYLFTRYKFNWDEVDYSIFSTYNMVTNLFGTMFSVGVFSHLLQIDDALIGVISCMSKILAGFVYAFAATPFVFYLGALVDIVNGTSFIAMRSIISKMVPPDEPSFSFCIALSGVILKHTGYYGVYSISLVLYTFSFIYGVFFIYELPPNYTQDATSGGLPSKPPTSDGLPSKPENVSFLKDFFDVRYIKDTFAVAFKNGEYNRKKRVILIMVVMIVVFGPIQGK
ncbi:uncharacterized protein LOC103505018 [Diaphorina citri]|uniref:Uncharacterized protein LOC103505018 n=1 Tax=Diaphorina citri TaxID=121845 RepID=A0A3Q0IJ06_DIACI|nr:uncharacterized protein LOC103505018 [Diaphorina citri]